MSKKDAALLKRKADRLVAMGILDEEDAPSRGGFPVWATILMLMLAFTSGAGSALATLMQLYLTSM